MSSVIPNGFCSTRAESAESYPVVVRLNSRWRVIACRDGIQWILQYRNRAETVARDAWRGRSYCRTSAALIRCVREYVGVIDPAAAATLAASPARIELPSLSACSNCEEIALPEEEERG
jgi:hypothetical protein